MKKRISNFFLAIVVMFSVFLVALAFTGNSHQLTPILVMGFCFALGLLLGFRLCSYLYETGTSDHSKKGNGLSNTKEMEDKNNKACFATSIIGATVEVAQLFDKSSRGSTMNKQDFFSN